MNVYEYLQDYHIKPSVQRIAIMEYLLEHKNHPTIDEIYSALCKQIPTLSKTTVYNTLKLFVEHGAANMLTIDDKNACFDSITSLHAHFQCKKCGAIYDIPSGGSFENIEENALASGGFTVSEVHRYYKGICPKCQGKMP